MSSSTLPHKPLCPCCFQAYSAAVAAGQATANSTTSTTSSSTSWLVCGVCTPDEVEQALASKATQDDTVPPILWLLTPQLIHETTHHILEATKTNLDAIAAVPLDEVTFDNTILPLMTPPNYKTNPQVAACKFLQHCSTNPAVRDAAAMAGKALAASRVEARMRKDVYERVVAFHNRPELVEKLTPYQQHFVTAIKDDLERSGLAFRTIKHSYSKNCSKRTPKCVANLARIWRRTIRNCIWHPMN